METHVLKEVILQDYHAHIAPIAKIISENGKNHQDKAKDVNKVIAEHQKKILSKLPALAKGMSSQQSRIILQYCTSVISLEYRHSVWEYEYMALSRRVGELWEKFCSASWDAPSRRGVERFKAPSFSGVGSTLRNNIEQHLVDHVSRTEILHNLDILFELVGEINMNEDEVFYVDGIPHVIDFKSGFGSNEKGNTLRLLTVGKAYKLWNPDTVLLFLVRQEQNNNYLNLIRKSKLWEVHCGGEAYRKIDELTGSRMDAVRKDVVNFQEDLSEKFWDDLSGHLSDLSGYLSW